MIFAGALALFAVGIAMLWGGAEWMVRGSAALGRAFGISSLVVGLTVVACATSMPELLVSLAAVLFRDAEGLALGNVVGSNMANIGLVLGLCAVVTPVILRGRLQTREVPVMIGVSLLFFALGARGGSLGRLDGALLLVVLVVVLAWMVRNERRAHSAAAGPAGDPAAAAAPPELPPVARGRALIDVVAGLAVLLAGAEFMTRSGVLMARLLEVPDVIIGLTMVALGTSLPELAASLVSVLRGHPELAFGNVVGSNLLNLTFVGGTVAAVRPLAVSRHMVQFELPVMVAFAVLLYVMVVRDHRVGRLRGALLLAAYVAAIVRIAF